ncbi:hypothetical protein LWS67_24210, partial [Bacillus atrophaeus]|uniref:hypothetical protein n=1 Tax=Bacillus atrophaeus TaxID=1452 RepID=UPI001EFBCDF8
MTDVEEMAAILEKIAAQADRAGQVIRGLRTMTRKHESVREPLDCSSLIAEVFKLAEFDLRVRGWKLVLNIEPGLPRVVGD